MVGLTHAINAGSNFCGAQFDGITTLEEINKVTIV